MTWEEGPGESTLESKVRARGGLYTETKALWWEGGPGIFTVPSQSLLFLHLSRLYCVSSRDPSATHRSVPTSGSACLPSLWSASGIIACVGLVPLWAMSTSHGLCFPHCWAFTGALMLAVIACLRGAVCLEGAEAGWEPGLYLRAATWLSNVQGASPLGTRTPCTLWENDVPQPSVPFRCPEGGGWVDSNP